MKTLAFAFCVTALTVAAPAAAQLGESQQSAPGYSSLMSADYASAVQEIKAAPGGRYDPARSINLGVALAKSGQMTKAEKEFRAVLFADNVEVVVFNGQTAMSHDVARKALAAMQGGVLAR